MQRLVIICDRLLKFALTDSMIWPALHCFYTMLGHPGSCSMHATLQARYHHPHLWMHIEWDMFINSPLLADWHTILASRKQLVNGTMFVPTKSKPTFDYEVDQKVLKYDNCCKANLNQKLQDSLTFSGSILTAQWQLACSLVLLNMSIFAALCHIESPHLCNLIWNSCFFLIDYGEEEWESSCVDSFSSCYGSLWHHGYILCKCPLAPLLFCLCVCWMPWTYLFKILKQYCSKLGISARGCSTCPCRGNIEQSNY